VARKTYNIRTVSLTDVAARIFDKWGKNKSATMSALIIKANATEKWITTLDHDHTQVAQKYVHTYSGKWAHKFDEQPTTETNKCNPDSRSGCCQTCWETIRCDLVIARLNAEIDVIWHDDFKQAGWI